VKHHCAMFSLFMIALGTSACLDPLDDPERPDEETSVAQAAATDASVWHTVWNGGSAGASKHDELSSAYVEIWEGGTGQDRSTYLWLSTSSVDPASQVCETVDWWGEPWTWCYYSRYTYSYGWGTVPARDAALSAGNAGIRTTLPQDGFYLERCTVDWSSGSYTCDRDVAGEIDLRWHKDARYSSFSSGSSRYTWGVYSYKSNGSWRSSSAEVRGSLLGVTMDGDDAWLSASHSVNISKVVVAATP